MFNSQETKDYGVKGSEVDRHPPNQTRMQAGKQEETEPDDYICRHANTHISHMWCIV